MKGCDDLTLEEQDEVLLVVGALGVLPVHVQAVEVARPQEGDGAVDEGLSGIAGLGHVLELLGAEGPATWKHIRVINTAGVIKTLLAGADILSLWK